MLAVRDLSGTDLYEVVYDLALTGTTPDGQPDTVTLDGTNGNDTIALVGDCGLLQRSGSGVVAPDPPHRRGRPT